MTKRLLEMYDKLLRPPYQKKDFLILAVSVLVAIGWPVVIASNIHGQRITTVDAAKKPSPTPTPTTRPTPTSFPPGVQLYVAPNGNDSNAGSQSAPFRTIQKAANVVTPGSTVHVAPGTYTGLLTILRGGNTTDGYVKFVSDVKHGAVIANSPTDNSHYSVTIKANYLQIEGFDIQGTRDGVDAISHDFIFRNNKLHNIHKFKPDKNGGSGITVYTDDYSATSNVTIDSNIVYDIGKSVGGSQLVQGIYISVPCSSCKITNNLVYQVEDFGIHAYHNPDGWIVANNTVFNNGRGILTGPNFKVVNNISMNNKTAGKNYDIRGTGFTVSNNISFGTGGGTWSGVTTADPQFVNYQTNGTGDYHLKPTSPALNTGTSSFAPAFDIAGTSRPQGAGYDLGIYEQ